MVIIFHPGKEHVHALLLGVSAARLDVLRLACANGPNLAEAIFA